MIIKITEQTAGQRLDKFLTERLKTFSRSQLQKLIKNRSIEINARPAAPHYALKAGDAINLTDQPDKTEKSPTAKKPENPAAANIKIIDETDEFLIINKPAGLAVHGRADYTLADWLRAEYPGMLKIGDDPERPGIVHRLDKDVSGLMVIAKTQAEFDHLKRQFKDRTVEKQYTGLAYGRILKDAGVINFPIKRARQGFKMAALPKTIKGEPADQGRNAITEFEAIKKLINFTLLKIKIKTGRTHQIRVHLAAYGHPLAGDNIYATNKTKIQNKKLSLGRIFLVADRLSFKNLANQEKSYKIDLPQELKNLLKTVK
ncbi:MAG: RluA family pseudouridine synthase [bacterium]|nr:RluA family pseudouridine synthase [bacterium]